MRSGLPNPGFLGSQDTFCVGNMKGVGGIYQQTFVHTYAQLYTTKNPIAAADGSCERFNAGSP